MTRYFSCITDEHFDSAEFEFSPNSDSAQIKKPSAQIPVAFYQHWIAEKVKKYFNLNSFNIANWKAYLYVK